MTQTEQLSPNGAGRTLAEIVAISDGPAPARAQPVPRRYRWIPIPDDEEFGYRGWEIRMWTNFPAHLINVIHAADDAKKKSAFYSIFVEHNGWCYALEDGTPGEQFPQPGAAVADGQLDFFDTIPQEIGNYLGALIGAEQRALSFLVSERRPTSRRS